MASFRVTYNTDATGTLLQLTPSPAVVSLSSGGGIDNIEIENVTASDITIEAIPMTCSAFDKPGKLMHFKVKSGQVKDFDLRKDLAGAFLTPLDFIPLLWKAKSKSGAVDTTPLIPRSAIHFQIAIQL